MGIAGAGIASTVYAASFVGWDKMIMPPSTRQHVNYHYPYVKVGFGAYSVQNPKVEIGTLGSGTAPLAQVGNSKITPYYNMALGYAFYNKRDNWVTRIFGHDNAVELQFSYFNASQNKAQDNLGTGEVWYIDGTGSVTTGPQPLTNFTLDSAHRRIDTGLYYRGKWIAQNPKISFSPRVGGVFTNLREKYNYSLWYTSPTPTHDLENYKINTNYYGLAAGGRLTYDLKSRFAIFGDLEGQLLHASAKLDAYQDAAVGAQAGKTSVKYNHSQTTYRAIAAVGGSYKLNNKITSSVVELKGGVDRWGYDPRVVPPNNANSRSVYLAGNHQNNFFANMEVTVPIG